MDACPTPVPWQTGTGALIPRIRGHTIVTRHRVIAKEAEGPFPVRSLTKPTRRSAGASHRGG